MIWVFLLWGFLTCVGFAIALFKITEAQDGWRRERSKNHAMCISAIFSQIGDAHEVSVLRAAAEAYESVEGRARMQELAHLYVSEGLSMPALWLHDRASQIEKAVKTVKETAA